MNGRWLALAIACAGCGDNLTRPADPLAPVSGARLALQKYRYDDGTEQAVATEFYDTELHVRCTPQPWPDAAVRCVPSVDDAEYTDPACTALVGLGRTITKPTHFVARDAATGAMTHVWRAGAAIAPIAQTYAIAGGACVGPTPVPAGLISFFAVGDEVDATALVAFHTAEIDDDRLGVQLRETDDGLRVPSGLRDRALDAACTATVQGDGSVVCEPAGAATASWFRDPGCSEPVVAAGASAPAIARFIEPSGCASYHRVGPEVTSPVYRRDGDACTPVDASALGQLFAVGEPIELPVLGRVLEGAPGRRLQRIFLGHGALRVPDDRLFDTALGLDCKPRALRDTVRCLPASAIAATTLFSDSGCTTQIRVAELPRHSCERPAFATANRPFQVRAIGEVATSPVFQAVGGTCQPYTGAPSNELRALGAPIDLTTFPSAIYFGER
ncbi:MAG TPA: hypothetical protein VF469_37195 [Kofleriaceae bacterium]